MFMTSDVEIDEELVDKRELGMYLALNRTPTRLPQGRAGEVIPLTSQTVLQKREEDRFKARNDPEEKPDRAATKKKLAESLSIGVYFTMKNHLYSFNGEMRRQEKGGPIGLALKGDVAQIAWWDKHLIEKLEATSMKVLPYTRYVDDIILVVSNTVRDESGEIMPTCAWCRRWLTLSTYL